MDDRGPLSGIVEADESYFGGKKANEHERKRLNAGRGAVGKTAVVAVVERNDDVIAESVDRTGQRNPARILVQQCS